MIIITEKMRMALLTIARIKITKKKMMIMMITAKTMMISEDGKTYE